LSLSGARGAAPVVSGAVSLVLERHGGLGPLPVRMVLQYSAEFSGVGILAGGTGNLNVLAALAMPDPASAPSIAGETQRPSQLVFTSKSSLPSAGERASAEAILWGNAETN